MRGMGGGGVGGVGGGRGGRGGVELVATFPASPKKFLTPRSSLICRLRTPLGMMPIFW